MILVWRKFWVVKLFSYFQMILLQFFVCTQFWITKIDKSKTQASVGFSKISKWLSQENWLEKSPSGLQPNERFQKRLQSSLDSQEISMIHEYLSRSKNFSLQHIEREHGMNLWKPLKNEEICKSNVSGGLCVGEGWMSGMEGWSRMLVAWKCCIWFS